MRRAQRMCEANAYYRVRRDFLVLTQTMHCRRHVPWRTIATGRASYEDIRSERPTKGAA